MSASVTAVAASVGRTGEGGGLGDIGAKDKSSAFKLHQAGKQTISLSGHRSDRAAAAHLSSVLYFDMNSFKAVESSPSTSIRSCTSLSDPAGPSPASNVVGPALSLTA